MQIFSIFVITETCTFFFLFFSFVLESLEIASVNLPIPVQTQNYYKNISDNKEIVKLVSVLSTIINSTKKVCVMRLLEVLDCPARVHMNFIYAHPACNLCSSLVASLIDGRHLVCVQ